MARIFVCYRRQDSAGHAGRLYDRLRAFFGSGRVFMDVEGIDPGADFTKVLDERIAGAEVVVAVIGPGWMAAPGPGGERRIASEGDYVRRELATALARDVEVIPVRVAGAEAPHFEDLPKELAELARRQMYVVSDGAFDAGMVRLIQAVERSAARTRERRRLAPRPKSQFPRRRWARLLLLYEPVCPATWVLHILFFAVLVLIVAAPIILWTLISRTLIPGDVGAEIMLLEVPLLVVPLLALRAFVLFLEPDAVVSPLRRWLLFYNPPRVMLAALHLLFLLMALMCLISPMALVLVAGGFHEMWNIPWRTALAALAVWIALVIPTFVVREIGASNDPVKPVLSSPNWFARLFCIWKPRHGLAWLPRIIYYAAFILFYYKGWFILFVDRGGDLGAQVVTATLLAAIAVSARGFSRAIEVGWPGDRAHGPMQLVKSSLLLYSPWRRAGFAAAALFWLGLGALAALTTSAARGWNLLGMDPGRPEPLVLSILLVVCAWGWAQLYRPPFKWTESEPGATGQR